MSEFEDKLNSVLGDPAQMEKIANLAKTLMGGDGGAQEPSPEPFGGLDIDPGLISRIGRLMNGDGDDNKQRLLQAMEPYLSEKRRGKMDKALKMARLARIAKAAMGEEGGDGKL